MPLIEESFEVAREQPQTLSIEVSGPAVAQLEGDDGAGQRRAGPRVRDVVELWARAVRLGLMGGADDPPAQCAATVRSRTRAQNWDHAWIVDVKRVDPGAFLILRNLLLGLDLERVALRTLPDPNSRATAPRLDLASLGLPRMPDDLVFTVDRRPAVHASRGRGVLLSFARPISDPVADAAIDALDLWAELIAHGGYAGSDEDRPRSSAEPDGAILYDDTTVSQSFIELFRCDEAAFDAVVAFAAASIVRGLLVVGVTIT